jgi:hypothetical protein
MTRPILDGLASFPRLSDVFIWSDYVELRCLLHPDKTFSRSTLVETEEEMGELLGGVNLDDAEEEDDDASDTSDEEFGQPEIQDKLTRKAADIFSHLRVRAGLFDQVLYPFEVDAQYQSISLKDDLTPWHHVYIQLLLSSALRYVPKTRRQALTDKFEAISHEIFKKLMPAGWEVHQFGKNSTMRYTGHLFDKLTALAADVRGVVTGKRTDFDAADRGDGGLDLVAWHPMGDDRRLVPIAFAQCGCTAEEYGMKMLEASPAKLNGVITVSHPWATYYFMPQALHSGSDWYKFSDFGGAIVLDRFRIMKLSHQYLLEASDLVIPALITEARAIEFA